MPVEFQSDRIPLPVRAGASDWGYGAALIAVPGTSSVLVSLPPGGPRTPWCLADLDTGRIVRGTCMPGHLRDAVFPPAGDPDPRPWVLGTFGLGRLQLEPRPTVVGIVRKGLGTYKHRVADLGGGLLGVGQDDGRSLILVRASDGVLVKRLSLAGPTLAYPLPGGRARVLSLYHAEVSDVDLTSTTVIARRPLPAGAGAGAALLGDSVVAVLDPDRTEPAGGDVPPQRIVVWDAADLTVRRMAHAPERAYDVLGADHAGRIAVSVRHGFELLDPVTLASVGGYRAGHGIHGAAVSPGGRTAALLGADGDPFALTVLRW